MSFAAPDAPRAATYRRGSARPKSASASTRRRNPVARSVPSALHAPPGIDHRALLAAARETTRRRTLKAKKQRPKSAAAARRALAAPAPVEHAAPNKTAPRPTVAFSAEPSSGDGAPGRPAAKEKTNANDEDWWHSFGFKASGGGEVSEQKKKDYGFGIPAWSPYFHVDEAKAAARRAAGGVQDGERLVEADFEYWNQMGFKAASTGEVSEEKKRDYGCGIPKWSMYHRRADGWVPPVRTGGGDIGAYFGDPKLTSAADPGKQAREARALLRNMKLRGTHDHTWGQLGGEGPKQGEAMDAPPAPVPEPPKPKPKPKPKPRVPTPELVELPTPAQVRRQQKERDYGHGVPTWSPYSVPDPKYALHHTSTASEWGACYGDEHLRGLIEKPPVPADPKTGQLSDAKKRDYGFGVPDWSPYHTRAGGYRFPQASSMADYGSYTKPGAIGSKGATPKEQALQARALLRNMKIRGTTDHTWGQLGGTAPPKRTFVGVPAGARPGDVIEVEAPEGFLLKVEVPEGSQGVSDMPGGQLQVNYED